MNAQYERVKTEIMEAIEEIALVKAPATDYLDALKDILEEVSMWFEASIEAAKDDVRRATPEE